MVLLPAAATGPSPHSSTALETCSLQPSQSVQQPSHSPVVFGCLAAKFVVTWHTCTGCKQCQRQLHTQAAGSLGRGTIQAPSTRSGPLSCAVTLGWWPCCASLTCRRLLQHPWLPGSASMAQLAMLRPCVQFTGGDSICCKIPSCTTRGPASRHCCTFQVVSCCNEVTRLIT